MNIIIALVTAATLWPAVLSAAESETEKKWKTDVAACVEVVRGPTHWPSGQPRVRSGFDAYTTPGLRVKYFGTERDIFQFEKCMAEKGHYLSDK